MAKLRLNVMIDTLTAYYTQLDVPIPQYVAGITHALSIIQKESGKGLITTTAHDLTFETLEKNFLMNFQEFITDKATILKPDAAPVLEQSFDKLLEIEKLLNSQTDNIGSVNNTATARHAGKIKLKF